MAVVHAGRDVDGLAADRHLDATGGAVEPLVGVVVADFEDLLADQLGDRGVGVGAHLAGHDDEARGQQGLDGDTEVLLVGVVLHEVVENGVADLVSDLVGVTLGHRLRREKASSHSDLTPVLLVCSQER